MMPTPWQRTVTTRVVSGEQKHGRSEKRNSKRPREGPEGLIHMCLIVVVLQCRGTIQWRQHQQGAAIFQWHRGRVIPFEASETPHSVEQQSREPPEHVSHVDPSTTSGKIALTPAEESRVGPKPLEMNKTASRVKMSIPFVLTIILRMTILKKDPWLMLLLHALNLFLVHLYTYFQ